MLLTHEQLMSHFREYWQEQRPNQWEQMSQAQRIDFLQKIVAEVQKMTEAYTVPNWTTPTMAQSQAMDDIKMTYPAE